MVDTLLKENDCEDGLTETGDLGSHKGLMGLLGRTDSHPARGKGQKYLWLQPPWHRESLSARVWTKKLQSWPLTGVTASTWARSDQNGHPSSRQTSNCPQRAGLQHRQKVLRRTINSVLFYHSSLSGIWKRMGPFWDWVSLLRFRFGGGDCLKRRYQVSS